MKYLLLALLLVTTLATAQVRAPSSGDKEVYSLSGTLEGKDALAFVLLSRKGSTKFRLSARVAIGDRNERWNEVFTVSEPRIVLHNPASVVDRVLGRRVPTTDLVVLRSDGKRLEVDLQEGGRSLGTLSGKRLDRAGPDPRDWRDSWLLRGPVARWGVARTFWDLVRRRGSQETTFRGDSDAALSASVAARLDLTQELSVATIYRAARAETSTDRAALEASVGFLFDTPDLLYRALPGIRANSPREDKFRHFFVSALLAHRSNMQGSLVVGWAKEVLDERPGGTGYNDEDLLADFLGASFGNALRFGEVRDY